MITIFNKTMITTFNKAILPNITRITNTVQCRSQLLGINGFHRSLNVFVIVFVLVFLIVFVFLLIVSFLVRLFILATLIKCLKGHKCPG